jgi:hypothetical protein
VAPGKEDRQGRQKKPRKDPSEVDTGLLDPHCRCPTDARKPVQDAFARGGADNSVCHTIDQKNHQRDRIGGGQGKQNEEESDQTDRQHQHPAHTREVHDEPRRHLADRGPDRQGGYQEPDLKRRKMQILFNEWRQDSKTGDVHEGKGMNQPQNTDHHPAIIGCLNIFHRQAIQMPCHTPFMLQNHIDSTSPAIRRQKKRPYPRYRYGLSEV